MRPLLAALLLLCLLPGAALARRPLPTVTPAVRHYFPPVWVTGYDLQGRTASGSYVHRNECATDWFHIPRGAIVVIPHVGWCHVEDTGVYGWAVDVWFPTAAECYRVTGLYRGAYYIVPVG